MWSIFRGILNFIRMNACVTLERDERNKKKNGIVMLCMPTRRREPLKIPRFAQVSRPRQLATHSTRSHNELKMRKAPSDGGNDQMLYHNERPILHTISLSSSSWSCTCLWLWAIPILRKKFWTKFSVWQDISVQLIFVSMVELSQLCTNIDAPYAITVYNITHSTVSNEHWTACNATKNEFNEIKKNRPGTKRWLLLPHEWKAQTEHTSTTTHTFIGFVVVVVVIIIMILS